jgi:hypothetical protein
MVTARTVRRENMLVLLAPRFVKTVNWVNILPAMLSLYALMLVLINLDPSMAHLLQVVQLGKQLVAQALLLVALRPEKVFALQENTARVLLMTPTVPIVRLVSIAP